LESNTGTAATPISSLVGDKRGMSLHWIVESRPRLVTVIAEGDVGKTDMEAYFALIVGANAVEWRKLFDARNGRMALSDPEVNELGVRIRCASATREVGPLAFVMPAIQTPELLRLLGFLAAAKRPMKVFHEIGPARKWIARLPP
jgi:hypothetical protein